MRGAINTEQNGQRREKGKQEENADKDKEEEEEYLFTANWQLENRRVRCILMQNTGQSSRGQTVQVRQNGKCFEVLSPCSYHLETAEGCVTILHLCLLQSLLEQWDRKLQLDQR